jgi:hypothetical protein
MSIVSTVLTSHMPHVHSVTNGWQTMNCPMCVQNGQSRPDTRHRGGVRIDGDVIGYHCFNCGYKTGWRPGNRLGFKMVKLMRAFGIDEGEIQRLKIQLWDQISEDEVTIEEPFEKPNWPEIVWPWPVQQPTDLAVEYIASRGLTGLADWVMSDDQPNRVILPYLSNNKLVGYYARYIGTPPGATVKALSSRPPKFVFNLDRQLATRKYCIVVEGEFDALSIDGVAIMSNNMSPEQAKIIEDLDNEPVILADRDRAGASLLDQGLGLGWSASFPDWPGDIKDANEAIQRFGRVATLQSIIAAIETNPLKIKLLMRKWCS